MHRNTYVLIFSLAIVAALVAGVNIAKKFQKEPDVVIAPTVTPIQSEPTAIVTAAATPIATSGAKISVIPSITGKMKTYTSAACGYSVAYPENIYSFKETSPVNATLVETANTTSGIVLLCENEIPKPALPPENTETKKYGNVTATLYHDSSAKDGTPVDGLIFRHPTKNVDVLIAGYGSGYNELLKTLKIIQ